MLPIRLPVNRKLLVKFWGVKGYIWIFTCMGSAPLPIVLFKGQMYSNSFDHGPTMGSKYILKSGKDFVHFSGESIHNFHQILQKGYSMHLTINTVLK